MLTCASDDIPLFELADNASNGNQRRGHIALIPEGESFAALAFIDEGRTLHACSSICGNLTPTTARQLGEELIVWADRKEGG